MKKSCSKCGVLRDEVFFTWNRVKDIHYRRAECKDCEGKRRKLFRQANKGHRATQQKGENRRYADKYPERLRAYRAFRAGVRGGKVVKLPCEVCGSEKSQGHHEDYAKPLDVIWLCSEHHTEVHHRV